MRTLLKLALLVTATCTIFGCAHNYYSIPQDTLEKNVKTIGIAPFFTDAESDIRHPDKQAIVSLVQSYNVKNQKELIARLRGTGIFYAVRQVEGDPARLFSGLLTNRERRDDAGIIYNKYFYKKDELKQLMSENGLDAVMFVTVSGLTRSGKVYASNYLSYLQTDFNYLAVSAQMLDREGNTIWEYPNFRRSALSYPMFFPLQYPAFDEAAANLSEKVDVKFKTVAGVSAAFAKSEPSKVAKEQQISSLYESQFDEILSLLKTYKPLFSGKEAPAAAPAAAPAPVETFKPAAAPMTTLKPEIAAAPVTAPAKPAIPSPAVAPKSSPSGAVPMGDIITEDLPAK